MFLLNSRMALFTAAYRSRRPLSRSYGANLPSSLAASHSSTLEYSSHLPVSVCGTVSLNRPIEVFLGSLIRASYGPNGLPIRISAERNADLPTFQPTYLNHLSRQVARLSLLRHPIGSNLFKPVQEY